MNNLNRLKKNLTASIEAKQKLLNDSTVFDIFNKATDVVISSYKRSGRLYIAGNGGSAADAQRMLDETGARGVVVGRGCLGRPWLFGQIRASFAGKPVPAEPSAGIIVDLMRRHADLLVQMHGDEFRGCQEMRKHMAWYLKGVVAGSETRGALSLISSLNEFDDLLSTINRDQILDEELAKLPRGRTTPDRRVNLPDGWLNSQSMSQTEVETVREAELAVSGG